MAGCSTHCEYVSILFTIFMKGPSVHQQSVTIPRQGFPGLLYEMIRLVEGVGILFWSHALAAAVFEEVTTCLTTPWVR
jgi:hypothetical protein